MGKVAQVRAAVEAGSLALDIEVDGGIDGTTAPVAARAGANVFVAGSADLRPRATLGGGRGHPGCPACAPPDGTVSRHVAA